MIQVLFVCLGNICRSPTADGIFRHLIAEANLTHKIQVDSAGTAGWHIGKLPDTRTLAAAKKRGYDLSSLRARQIDQGDFTNYDYILAMDNANLAHLQSLKPPQYSGHLGLFLAFGSHKNYPEVPDPYHGGDADFELVLDLIEDAAQGLLAHILKQKN